MFLTAPQVAAQIGISYHSFLRSRNLLEAEHGFPQPMPHTARPLKWRADLVAHWITTVGLPRAQASAQTPRGRPNLRLIQAAATA